MLTEHERVMLSQLRCQQMKWHRDRWYMLISGVLVSAGGLWLLVQVIVRAEGATKWDGEVVWLCPLFWGIFSQGVLMCM